MGFGEFIRDITVTQHDTDTDETLIETIVTSTGAYPSDMRGREFRGMLGSPAAWRASQLLTDVLGSMPYHAYVEQPDGTSLRRYPTPRLLTSPAGGPNSRMVVYSSWALDLIWHGNAIGIVWERDEYGEPDIVVPVPAEFVYVKYKDEADYNMPFFKNGEVVYMIGNKAYREADIIHIKGICRPGALRGMGVLEEHFKVLQLDMELRKQASAASGAGVPTGVLETLNPDLKEADLLAIRDSWMKAQNTRKVAVLSPGVKYEALAWNPTESQLLEARKFSHVELALIFGVDPEWLGAAQTSRTYQNIEQSGIELVRRSALNGHLGRIEPELSRHLRPGTCAKANLDSVQRADTYGRYQSHQIGIDSGFLLDDEARAMENLPPLTPEQRQQIKDAKPKPAEPKLLPASAGVPAIDVKKKGAY